MKERKKKNKKKKRNYDLVYVYREYIASSTCFRSWTRSTVTSGFCTEKPANHDIARSGRSWHNAILRSYRQPN